MYWVIEQDLRIPGIGTVTDVPNEIDIMAWMSGKMLKLPTQPITLTLARGSGEYRGEIIGGVVTLFSDELIDALKNEGITNFQAFPVDLEDPHTGEIEEGYSLINIIGLIDCVKNSTLGNKPLNRPSSLEKFNIEREKTGEFSLFRLRESPRLIVIDEKLHKALDKPEYVGIRMRQTDRYTVW